MERRQPASRTFRQWLLLRYCEEVFAEHGFEGFAWLARHHWYQLHGKQIDPIVRGDMRINADLAAGYWYRRYADTDGQADYAQLVFKLARSSRPDEYHHAFHLIRHSATTAGRKDVQIAPALHAALAELWSRSEPRKTIPDLTGLYCANFPDDPACRGRRKTRRSWCPQVRRAGTGPARFCGNARSRGHRRCGRRDRHGLGCRVGRG